MKKNKRKKWKDCTYLRCKYGKCNAKSTCWTHEHTNNIIKWNKFMKMVKESEEVSTTLDDSDNAN